MMTIEIRIWWSWWLLRLWVDGIMISYIWDCTLTRGAWLLLYKFIILKVTGTGLFDRNIPVQSYCSSYTRILLPFTVTDIVHCVYDYYWLLYCTVTVTVSSRILSNMILILLTELNNNGQLTLGLGKLVEETASVFLVDLRYRLRSRLTVPLQGSGGWLTSYLFSVPLFS